MFRNVASQNIGGRLTSVISGQFYQPSSGLVQTYVSRDGGALNLSAVASGIARPTSYGVHLYTPAQSEMDFDHLFFTFVVSGAIPIGFNVYTRNDSTNVAIGSLQTRVGSLDTRVGSLDTRVGSDSVSIGSLHTRVSSLSALIGVPLGADLATDVKSIAVQVGSNFTALGSLHTRVGSVDNRVAGVGTNVDSLHTRVGSVATQANSIQTMVNSIYDRIGDRGINITSAQFAATVDYTGVASSVWGSTSAAALTANIGSLHTRVSSVDVRVGSLSTLVGSAYTQIGSNATALGSLSGTALTLTDIASTIWSTPLSSHVTSGFAGYELGTRVMSVHAMASSLVASVGSLHTRVSSAAVEVGSNAIAIGSLHTRVGSLTTLIGLPVGATLATDVKSIQTMVNSIYDRIGDRGINLTSAAASAPGTTITEIASAALARFFNRDSGLYYANAVSGSVVAEITKNAGGAGLTVTDIASGVWGSTSAAALNSSINSLHTRVSSAAVEIASGAVAIGSLHTRVGSLSALIGTPVGANLATDVKSIQTQVDSIYGRIGAPIGTSLAVDVSSIQVGVGSLGISVSSVNISAGSISTALGSLHTRVGSVAVEAASGGISLSSLHTRVGSLSALVGAPVGGTVAVDVGSIQTGVRSLTALIAGGRMTANVDAVNSDANAASNLRRGTLATVVGNTTGDSTTSVLSTAPLVPAAAVADQFLGRVLIFDRDTLTAALRGQATAINSNTVAGLLHVASLTTAPPSGNTFTIV